MAAHADSTTASRDAIDESLNSARWFLTHRRFLMALETLRAAAIMCRDARRDRIAALVSALEGAPVALLVA